MSTKTGQDPAASRRGLIQALGVMDRDHIAEVKIDETGRLHVVPSSRSFPYIYREAMEVHWDPEHCSLYSPIPRDWSYGRWFKQILIAAREQGCELQLAASTQWSNVPAGTKAELLRPASDA